MSYINEMRRWESMKNGNIAISVVDTSDTTSSREFLRNLDSAYRYAILVTDLRGAFAQGFKYRKDFTDYLKYVRKGGQYTMLEFWTPRGNVSRGIYNYRTRVLTRKRYRSSHFNNAKQDVRNASQLAA